MATVCRRASDPHAVQNLWSAIRFVRAQKQIASEERIIRQVRREHGDSEADTASMQLHHAVADGLIIAYHTQQQKVGTAGLEQIAYRIPDEDQVNRVKDLPFVVRVQCIMLNTRHYSAVCVGSVYSIHN